MMQYLHTKRKQAIRTDRMIMRIAYLRSAACVAIPVVSESTVFFIIKGIVSCRMSTAIRDKNPNAIYLEFSRKSFFRGLNTFIGTA